MAGLKRYIFNQFVAMDIALNALIGGSPYETISERVWRHKWKTAIWLIDGFFGLFGEVDHCKNSAEGNEAQYEVWR